MNRDSEAIENLLAWLQQDPNLTDLAPSGKDSRQEVDSEASETTDPQLENSDPLDSEEFDLEQFNPTESGIYSLEEYSTFELGDIPAVQDRFHALLKRRLQSEIERKPPLFPWETQLREYGSETASESLPVAEVLPVRFWGVQLQTLLLPTFIPESLLDHLFQTCQLVVQTSLREGEKLVRAVELMFPGHDQTLGQLAGLVLAAPTRSGQLAASGFDRSAGMLTSYEEANPAQQMALSLVTAQQILNALTLVVAPNRSHTQQQWLTQVGTLLLEVDYHAYPQPRLRLQGQLPCEGALHLSAQDDSIATQAERSTPGELIVELPNVVIGELYSLKVYLDGEQQPLHLVVQCLEA